MTKKELIENVANRVFANKNETKFIINALFDELSELLESNETLFIRGFGTLKVVQHKERKGRNIKLGREVNIPKRKRVKFIASKKLLNKINK